MLTSVKPMRRTPEVLAATAVRVWRTDPLAYLMDPQANYGDLKVAIAWAIRKDREEQGQFRGPHPTPTTQQRAEWVVAEWLADDRSEEEHENYPKLTALVVQAIYADRDARAAFNAATACSVCAGWLCHSK